MKKIILIISIIFLILIILITQRFRIFFKYSTNTIDSLDIFIRTNVFTGDTEMLNPLTLEWIDSEKLLEINEINNTEEEKNA